MYQVWNRRGLYNHEYVIKPVWNGVGARGDNAVCKRSLLMHEKSVNERNIFKRAQHGSCDGITLTID